MTDNRDALARHWHNMTDHATDGTPFGGPLCNCKNLAPRLARIKADAAAETTAAIEAVHHKGYNSDRDETWGANPVCEGCEQSWPCETITALSAGRTALDTRLAQAWDECVAWMAHQGQADVKGWLLEAAEEHNPYRAEANGEGQ